MEKNLNKKLEKMMHYFASVPRGTAYQNQLDLQKLWGFKREYAKQSIEAFATKFGLKTKPIGDGIWEFTKG